MARSGGRWLPPTKAGGGRPADEMTKGGFDRPFLLGDQGLMKIGVPI